MFSCGRESIKFSHVTAITFFLSCIIFSCRITSPLGFVYGVWPQLNFLFSLTFYPRMFVPLRSSQQSILLFGQRIARQKLMTSARRLRTFSGTFQAVIWKEAFSSPLVLIVLRTMGMSQNERPRNNENTNIHIQRTERERGK